jgi:hypothetical protein
MFNVADNVSFLYTTEVKAGKPARTVQVIGTVVPNSPNVKNPKIITVKLDDPTTNDNRPYMSCNIDRINMAVPA